MRFWLSWFEPVDEESPDPRPKEWPLADGIVHYWVTGWGMSTATLVAVVDAEDEDAAKNAIRRQGWSPGWRFCEPQPDGWMPPEDRFPVKSRPAGELR